jgi:predicted transcriptional regulator
MTKSLEKAIDQVAKLATSEQEDFANFILDELAFRSAVQEGIRAADASQTVPLEEVKKMIPKWASK